MMKVALVVALVVTSAYVARNYSGVIWSSPDDPESRGVAAPPVPTAPAADATLGATTGADVALEIDIERDLREMSPSLPDSIDKETPLVLARLLKSLTESPVLDHSK